MNIDLIRPDLTLVEVLVTDWEIETHPETPRRKSRSLVASLIINERIEGGELVAILQQHEPMNRAGYWMRVLISGRLPPTSPDKKETAPSEPQTPPSEQ